MSLVSSALAGRFFTTSAIGEALFKREGPSSSAGQGWPFRTCYLQTSTDLSLDARTPHFCSTRATPAIPKLRLLPAPVCLHTSSFIS